MTETDIQESLFNRFLTLNEFSGKPYLTDGNTNVSLPNKKFSQPSNNKWFALSFRSNQPNSVGIGELSQNEFTGFFQIDICTPLDKGEEEPNKKYGYIASLFKRGTSFDDVLINKVYRSNTEKEENHYKTVVTVLWTARIDNE